MENDNKKKKNKKKKNKQAKNAESTPAALTVASVSANQMPDDFDQKQQTNAFQAEHTPVTPQPSAAMDRHGVTASNNDLELKFSKLRSEKEYWLQKEGILEEKIKQLQMEKEEYIKKEADLQLIVSKLQTEKDSWLRRETGYEEKIRQLVNEASTTSSKEVFLEEKIKQLETERESWAQKEVFLEEKIKQLETERESWAQKENCTTETVDGLNADKARLHLQVMELEVSQKNLSQENQQLLENISGLQKQIQNSAHLSSKIGELENEHIKSEMLAAQTMVEKLLLENAKLAEKLNAERDRPGTMAELSSAGSGPVAGTIKPVYNDEHSSVISDPANRTAERVLSIPAAEYQPKPDPIAGTPEKLATEVVDDASSEYQPLLKEKTIPVENGEVFREELRKHSNHNDTPLIPDSAITVSTEIEQIPAEENAASGSSLPVEDSSSDETTLVPISDAPLIGAPFRFISFMARYVSGADLVN